MATLIAPAAAVGVGDTIITIPAGGGIARVEQPGPRGIGREVWSCAPQTIGRLLAGLENDSSSGNRRWVDLLAAGNPGLALSQKGQESAILLAFPARTKQVKQLHSGGRGGAAIDDATFHLPPTIWVLRFNSKDMLAGSWLFMAPNRPSGVGDELQVMASPFGNAYHPHGAICWGNVTTSNLRVGDPLAVDNLFWGTGFNTHLVRVENFLTPAAATGAGAGAGTGGRSFTSYTAWTTWLRANPTTPLEVRYADTSPFKRTLAACLKEGVEAGE